MRKVCQGKIGGVNRVNIEVNQHHISSLFELAQSLPRTLSWLTIEARDREPHHLVLVEKIAATPRDYPRKPGIPTRKPL